MMIATRGAPDGVALGDVPGEAVAVANGDGGATVGACLAAFVGYLEWGTRLALHNSQPGADVAQQAPVPHWGWGVAPPYQP